MTGQSYGEGRVVWGFRVIFDKNLSEKKIVSFERVHEKNYYFVFALECYAQIEEK